jgi:hypothetical protein
MGREHVAIRPPDPADHDDQNLDCQFVPPTRLPFHSFLASSAPEPVLDEPVLFASPVATATYPGMDYEQVFQNLPRSDDPADREITIGNETSSQFPWIDLPYEFGVSAPQTICPDHNSKRDRTLLRFSVKKRLRFRSRPDVPVPLTPNDVLAGTALFQAHCRAYHRDPEHVENFDPVLFAECISLNEYNSLTSKTQAVIAANHERSDPDWRSTVVRIFSKTQQKVNDGSIFGPWKACQTLALMHDAVLLIFGPVVKYLEKHDKRDAPPNLFSYGGKTPHDLSDAAKMMRPGERAANDYTSFDQCQGRESQFLEERRMARESIPSFIIDWYIFIKTNLECQFGPLTSMRFTGEPGTYRFNTDYNIAIIYLMHEVPSDCMVFVSGDDSLLERSLPIHPRWYILCKLFPNLMFKMTLSRYETFCGYYLSHVGAVRAPLPMCVKLAIAEADGSIGDKIDSYLTEFSVGHSLGQDLWQALPEDQVFYQSALFDFFSRRASKHSKQILRLGEVSQHEIDQALMLTGAKLPARAFAFLSNGARKILSKLHRRASRFG